MILDNNTGTSSDYPYKWLLFSNVLQLYFINFYTDTSGDYTCRKML